MAQGPRTGASPLPPLCWKSVGGKPWQLRQWLSVCLYVLPVIGGGVPSTLVPRSMCVLPASQSLRVHERRRREGGEKKGGVVRKGNTNEVTFPHLVWLTVEMPSVAEQEQGGGTPPAPSSPPESPVPHTLRASPGQLCTICRVCNPSPPHYTTLNPSPPSLTTLPLLL